MQRTGISVKFTTAAACFAVFLGTGPLSADEPPGPRVGELAKPFTLSSLDGRPTQLQRDLLAHGPVVLVVLRGYPGYQCPLCQRQFIEILGNASKFAASQTRVAFVYPGPKAELEEHARAFLGERKLPHNLVFLVDPTFVFTQDYGLRWDAKGETAYPASFVIDRQGVVRFAKVSRSHGGRATASELLQAVSALEAKP